MNRKDDDNKNQYHQIQSVRGKIRRRVSGCQLKEIDVKNLQKQQRPFNQTSKQHKANEAKEIDDSLTQVTQSDVENFQNMQAALSKIRKNS